MSPRIRNLVEVRVWLRAHPQLTDLGMALAMLAVGLPGIFMLELPREQAAAFRDPDLLQVALVSVLVLALAFRRRAPLLVLLFDLSCGVLLAWLDYPSGIADTIAYFVALYSVAAHRPLARSLLGWLLGLVFYHVALALQPIGVSVPEYLTNLAMLGGVWVLGRNLRLRRAYMAELEDRAARLERARGTDARAARVEERARIARELHDVVAHHVSVMTVQAGAARRILEANPGGAKEAMTTIEEVGRTALSEMRRIVGVLRTERDPQAAGRELSPQPGIRDLEELIDNIRETGLAVQLWVDGQDRPLSPGVDLAAFRLIQEALTNTLKHAGPQARAWVRLRYTDTDLTVEIEDNGQGAAASILADGGESPGHGLVGMYERVALYGGELRIGPRVGGGFGVRARFPLEA